MNICPICGRQAAETDMVQVYGQVMCKTCAAEKNYDAFRNPSQKSKQQVAESAPPIPTMAAVQSPTPLKMI